MPATKELMPYVRVAAYRDNRHYDRYFADMERAMEWVRKMRLEHYNLYRIEKVNGTWRTDWEVV